MRNSYTSPLNPWRLSVLVVLSLGLCAFYFANASRALAIESTSPLFQQNQPGVNSQQEKPGQPMALPEETPNPSPGIFATFIRLILALALTVGLILVTVWGLKIVWEKRGLTNNADEAKPIKVLTSTYLAPRKAIHLVEVGSRILVLGVGNDEITRLDVITDPAEVESIRQSTQTGFPNILDRLMHREVVEKTDAETQQMIAESNETVGGYVEKLKRAGRKRKDETENSDNRS
jgi:flagellar biogenesis protein FliO